MHVWGAMGVKVWCTWIAGMETYTCRLRSPWDTRVIESEEIYIHIQYICSVSWGFCRQL